MVFHTREEIECFMHSLVYLGQGSQGVCYKDRQSKVVYKFYHSYFENDFEGVYGKEEIEKFKNIKSSTFVFPKDVMMLNDQVIGDITPYKKAKNLYQVNPFNINLDRFIKLVALAVKDIEELSKKGIQSYDVMYNILWGYQLYIIDTLEYSFRDQDWRWIWQRNLSYFNLEIMYFLVDGIFGDVINHYSKLRDMYESKGREINIVAFIMELKNCMSKMLGHEITYLKEAKEFQDHHVLENTLKYERDIMVRDRILRLEK